jgi:hypothetical protein
MDRSETPARRIGGGEIERETRRGGFIVPQPGHGSLFLERRHQREGDLEIDRIDCLIPNAEFFGIILIIIFILIISRILIHGWWLVVDGSCLKKSNI